MHHRRALIRQVELTPSEGESGGPRLEARHRGRWQRGRRLAPGGQLQVRGQRLPGTGGIDVQLAEGPGVVSVPIHAFLDPPDDWRSIRSVFFSFSVNVTGPLAFTIGEVRAVAGAVPAAPTSWGRVKAADRGVAGD